MQQIQANSTPTMLATVELSTKLGNMLVISDTNAIYLLGFTDEYNLDKKINSLELKTGSKVNYNLPELQIISQLRIELAAYFAGNLQQFTVKTALIGTQFQRWIWRALLNVKYAHTVSYKQLANSVGAKCAIRAIANANAANKLAILLPCHRIIRHNGELGGYNGGIERKQWLIAHERYYGNYQT